MGCVTMTCRVLVLVVALVGCIRQVLGLCCDWGRARRATDGPLPSEGGPGLCGHREKQCGW